jgi:protein gp37
MAEPYIGKSRGSGPKSRYMHPIWARDLRDQCRGVGMPFFFKTANRGDHFPDLTAAREWPKGYIDACRSQPTSASETSLF